MILTSTSKTYHKSQIGKTEEKHHSPKKKKKITVNLQEATIKKLVISKRKMTHTGDKQYY